MIKIDGHEVTQRHFPDGTWALNGMGGVFSELKEHTDFDLAAMGPQFVIEWRYESEEEMSLLWFMVCHLRDKCHAASIELVLPYIPNARMDRSHGIDECATLKYFAEFINMLNFSTVYVLDPHSNVSHTLINRMVEFNVKEFIDYAVNAFQPDYLYFPDKGAYERYEKFTTRTPFYGIKNRDWRTGKILGITVENPYNIPKEAYQGKRVLIVDDICSAGGTFFYGGKALKEAGFGEIDLYVTHCENTIFTGKLLGDESPISRIITTDSLKRAEHDKIEVIEMDLYE